MKKRAIILAMISLSSFTVGCEFIDHVNENTWNKNIKLFFDDENEFEKFKEGNSELQKSLSKEKEEHETRVKEREDAKASDEEEGKQENAKKKFSIKWKE